MRNRCCRSALLLASFATGTLFAQAQQNTWYITGRVVMDDGVPPPERVAIECICNGATWVAAHTDRQGEFGFRAGASSSRGLQDASVGQLDGSFGRPRGSGGMPPAGSQDDPAIAAQTQTQTAAEPRPRQGPADQFLKNCELNARLAGYLSEPISLASRKPSDSPDVGVIILHRLSAAEDETVSITWLSAPANARKALASGRAAFRKGRIESARKSFEKAVQLHPRFAAAWCELGSAHIELGRMEEGRRGLETAIRSDPKFLEPYLRLAALEAARREWAPLAETTAEALRLDPLHHAQAYYLNGLANYRIGRLDLAETSAREAVRLDTHARFPRNLRLLGAILAERRDYTAAAAQFREYLKLAPRGDEAEAVRRELAQVEKLQADSTAEAQKTRR